MQDQSYVNISQQLYVTLTAAREVQINRKILEQYQFLFTDIVHTQTQNKIK